MKEYNLNSPFLTLTFDGKPDYWPVLVAVWILVWIGVIAGLAYLYAVVFKQMVGFETAALVGLLLILMEMEARND